MNELVGVRHHTLADAEPINTTPLKVVPANDLDDLWMGEPIAHLLEAVPTPDRFYMLVTQVKIREKVGSIILPGTAVKDQDWTHGLGIVVKVGPAVYKGRRFADIGLDESDGFTPGDLVLFNAGASPNRIYVDDRLFLMITDDSVRARPKREHAHRIKFTI
jgi:hypothetical protein